MNRLTPFALSYVVKVEITIRFCRKCRKCRKSREKLLRIKGVMSSDFCRTLSEVSEKTAVAGLKIPTFPTLKTLSERQSQ